MNKKRTNKRTNKRTVKRHGGAGSHPCRLPLTLQPATVAQPALSFSPSPLFKTFKRRMSKGTTNQTNKQKKHGKIMASPLWVIAITSANRITSVCHTTSPLPPRTIFTPGSTRYLPGTFFIVIECLFVCFCFSGFSGGSFM